MRAKVIFTDGFFTSPTIETNDKDLKDRIELSLSGSQSIATTAAGFVTRSHAGGYPVSILNTPEGMSFGGTYSKIMNKGFWPAQGDQAGVFLVWRKTQDGPYEVEFWGGRGFEGTPEFTPSIPQKMELTVESGEDQD